jgi:hypothetical protein
MKDLIEALTIFAKYRDEHYPTICHHDELVITWITREEMSAADVARVEELGFNWFEGVEGYWYSFRFGSA